MIISTIPASNCTPQTIVIGRRGTYDTMQIAFDLSFLIENYGSGTAVLAVKRSQDESAYPAVVTQEDNTLTWTISDTDTYYVGSGECQLMWYVDGGLAKTIIYPMVVMRDILATSEDAPDAYPNWIESLTALGAETLQNAQDAAQSASDAEDAKDDAITSKEAAEAALESAETAVTHYPTIQNNYWMVWDVNNQQYVSTGIQAEGEDGYSPEITITSIEGGHRVTITDKDHPQGQSFDVMDGQGGSTGDYDELTNKPQINGHPLTGNQTAEQLGLATPSDIPTDAGGIGYDDSATYQSGTAGAALSALNRQISDVESAVDQKVDKYREEEVTDISLDKFEIVPTYYFITTYANTPAVQFSTFAGSGKTWIWSKLKNDYSDVFFKVHYGMFNTAPTSLLTIAATETKALAIQLNVTSNNAQIYTDTSATNVLSYPRNTNCRDIAADDTLHCVNDSGKIAIYLVDNGAEVPLFANEFIDVLSFWASANFTEDEIGFGLVSNNSSRGEPLLYDFSTIISIGEDFITRDEAMEEIDAIKQSEIAKNLYLKKDLLDKTAMQEGYIDSSGNAHSGGGLLCTDFILVESGYVYCSGGVVYTQYFAFYNEDKSLNSSYSTLGGMNFYPNSYLLFYIAVPENAKYFRCTYDASSISNANNWISQTPERPYSEDVYSIDRVYPETMNPANPCEYSELSIRAFHKIACIGDSITYGGMNYTVPTGGVSPVNTNLSAWYSYPTKLAAITGIETTNFGISGDDSAQWYEEHKNTDFSGYDCAIIHLGINDSAHGISDEATTTAINNIITMLKTASKDIRIFVCNVIAAYDGTGYQAKGNLIMNYAASLDDPYVIPLDLSQHTHVRPETSYVAGHLTSLGYYMMAYDLARYISWYIDQNKRDFRFIQFIGTDAVYP